MLFSTKRSLRLIKIMLITPQTEFLLLCARIFSICMLLFKYSLIDIQNNFMNLDASNMKNIQFSILLQQFNDYSTQSQIDSIYQALQDVIWKQFAIETDEERIIGGLRLIQYRRNLDNNCSLLFQNNLTMIQILSLIDGGCNIYDSDSLERQQPESFNPLNQSLCIQESCSEFQKDNINRKIKRGILDNNQYTMISTPFFGPFPFTAFIVEINYMNKSDFKNQIQKLKDNQWMDIQSTYAVAIQFNTYNLKCDVLNIFTYIVQITKQGKPLIYLNKRFINTITSYSVNWTVFSVILMFSDLLFIFKLILEGSILPKNTHIPVVFNILIELAFTSICLIEQSTFRSILSQEIIPVGAHCKTFYDFETLFSNPQQFLGSISSCHQYIIFDGLVFLIDVRIIFQGFTLFFLPFNIFWLFTYVHLFEGLIRFANMIFRTLHPMLKLSVIIMVVYLCQTAGFYIVFRNNFQGFKNYGNSLYSYFIWHIPKTSSIEYQIQSSYTNIYLNTFEIIIFQACRGTMYLIVLTAIITSIKCGIDFQYDFRTEAQKENISLLTLLQKKLEKFQKNYLSENKVNKYVSRKLVVMLNKDLFSQEDTQVLIDECSQNDITIQSFSNIIDLIQFLDYLFKIKPQLLFKSSIYFRIVIDLEISDHLQSEYFQNEQKQLQQENIVMLLNLLRDKGSRVPLLLNFKQEFRPSDSILIMFFRLYHNLHLNQCNFDDFKNFIMSSNIKNFKQKIILKHTNKNEYDEDEDQEESDDLQK